MSLKDKLLQELQQAMRTQNIAARNTLRLLRAAIGNAEIDAGRSLNEAEEIEILTREAKRRREAIDEYTPLGRQDKIDEAKTELAIIEEYLPRQMERSEIEILVRQAIAESGISDPSRAGDLMRRIMPQVKGRADGRLVSEVIRDLLTTSQ